MNILLTGGSACGKSTFAESLCEHLPMPRYYIATMRPYDDECLSKIARHREQRKEKGFITIEQHTDLSSIMFPQKGTALLECMCNLTANEMFAVNGEILDVHDKILKSVFDLAEKCDNLIVVTNDVGSDAISYDKSTALYIEMLGRLNREIASGFDCVCELVCGIPLTIKGELP